MAGKNKKKRPQLKSVVHQIEFVNDSKTKNLALVGGYGCGKTWAFCLKGIRMAELNKGFTGALLEPTQGMVAANLLDVMDEILELIGLPYEYRASKPEGYTLFWPDGQTSKIRLAGAENYKRIFGANLAWAGIDELDLIEHQLAKRAWNACITRIRVGKVNQMFGTSTPEGYKFMHEYFVEQADETKRCIHGKTEDNPKVPWDYIENIRRNHTEQQCLAYLEGQFVNVTTGNVYYAFDRVQNGTLFTLADFDPDSILHVGLDFNIGKMAAIVSIIKDGVVYTIDEIGGLHTPDIIAKLKEKFPGRTVIVYPDPAGTQGNANGQISSIALLKDAGFECRYPKGHAPILDRVAAVNARFRNANKVARHFVNIQACPLLVKGLEQQGFDNGKPDKSGGLDHSLDALGYFVHYKYPLLAGGTYKAL